MCQPADPAIGTAELLARFLFVHAHGQPVRTMEAIAAVVVNQVTRDRASGRGSPATGRVDQMLRERLRQAGTADMPGAVDPGGPAFEACLRIARRAIAGALHDPTGGATLFHPLGSQPPWARHHVPAAVVGGFLFYREEPAIPPAET